MESVIYSRSRSRSRSRDRRDKKSRERRRSRSNSPKSSPLQYSGPKIQLEDNEETEIDIIKRNKAIEEIEMSGFEQKSFSKTANNADMEIKPEFEFATAAEKATYDTASKVIEQLESEGLCHPLWFQDPKERESKYLRYLTSLKKKLISSGKYKA